MPSTTNPKTESSNSLPWDVVEKVIHQEAKWLKSNLVSSPFQKENRNLEKKYIYRRIAVLIVSGKVQARDIKSDVSLWERNKELEIRKEHGEKWHSSMMKKIGGYLQRLGYEVITEPALNIGRADLGAYQENHNNLYVEVGTLSLYKLLLNLESMESSTFLIVLSSDHVIDFSVLKAGYKELNL